MSNDDKKQPNDTARGSTDTKPSELDYRGGQPEGEGAIGSEDRPESRVGGEVPPPPTGDSPEEMKDSLRGLVSAAIKVYLASEEHRKLVVELLAAGGGDTEAASRGGESIVDHKIPTGGASKVDKDRKDYDDDYKDRVDAKKDQEITPRGGSLDGLISEYVTALARARKGEA